jgi:transposase
LPGRFVLRAPPGWFSTTAITGIFMSTPSTALEIDMKTLEDALRRAEEKLNEKDYATLKAVVNAYAYLTELVDDKNTTIARLRKMLFGVKTEKTAAVIDGSAAVAPASDAKASGESNVEGKAAAAETDSPTSPPTGHGRNGADAYHGAEKIEVRHESLQPGDPCPQCENGTLYDTRRSGVLVRLVGQAPIAAKVYYLQKLRCGLCGIVFTATPPEGVNAEEKRDETVGSMIALLKYGTGMPFSRNETLQTGFGVPLPASTQWDIVAAQAKRAEPVFDELAQQAAQGDIVYNDDTTVKILSMMGKRAGTEAAVDETADDAADDLEADAAAQPTKASRKGLFTTGIISQTHDGQKIALFLSGRQHAGENLADVLARRARELAAPIQMCDALSRNLPGELQTILANCLAHGRRKFVDVAERLPEECRHVLESLAVVYHNDATAKQRNLSPQHRLLLHQAESGPTMAELHRWLGRQFDERRGEPHSALGAAITYLLRHGEKLTLFLRVAGAPLDNNINICEQALKWCSAIARIHCSIKPREAPTWEMCS